MQQPPGDRALTQSAFVLTRCSLSYHILHSIFAGVANVSLFVYAVQLTGPDDLQESLT